MASLYEQVDAAIDMAKWEGATNIPGGKKAIGYLGLGNGWNFVLASFKIEDDQYTEDMPEDFMGYDGTAAKNGQVVRLTREQAARAFKKAAGK